MAQESLFKKLEQIDDIASMSKADRIKYDESIKKYRDTLAVMSGQWLEGKEEGLQEGIAKVAKNMKTKGMPYEQIAALTGLAEETIKSL
jgi:predicted transposase/invertase (TIGR01784 family)